MKAHPHAEVIKAWADGIPCQIRQSEGVPWKDIPTASEDPASPAWYRFYQYRIKPETRRYRVALCREGSGYWTCTADNIEQEKAFEASFVFIKWLTDWIEVEVNE